MTFVAGLRNIVTGSFLDEYEQMGTLPPDYGVNRYRYAKEWFHGVKRLRSEESVTFDGEWFHLQDCRSSPKPVQKPHPQIICAGTSDEGFRFTAEVGNHSFLAGRNLEHTKELSRRMKGTALEYGRSIKTATTLLPIIEETDEAAQNRLKQYQEGADLEALGNIAGYYGRKSRE